MPKFPDFEAAEDQTAAPITSGSDVARGSNEAPDGLLATEAIWF